jgi:hypothetical protein
MIRELVPTLGMVVQITALDALGGLLFINRRAPSFVWERPGFGSGDMKSGFAIAATWVALSLLAIPSGAQANILQLDTSNVGIGLAGTGGSPPSLTVTISGQLTGSAHQFGDANVGTYFLKPSVPTTFTAGPESAGVFPVSGVTELFNFAAADGAISGTVTWKSINDIGVNLALFVGTFTGMGTMAYSSFSAPGQLVTLITSPFGAPTLSALASTPSSATVAVSSGAIQSPHAIPSPLIGAGLPGLVAACGGLLLLARRRRRQAII